MSEINESEAIERFTDALAQAADAMKQLEYPKKYAFSSTKFMSAMTAASGSANQLAHMQNNPDFLGIRDAIEKLKTQTKAMATDNYFGIAPKRVDGENPFKKLAEMLLGISEMGKRIATSKSIDRVEALAAIDMRAHQASVLAEKEEVKSQGSTVDVPVIIGKEGLTLAGDVAGNA